MYKPVSRLNPVLVNHEVNMWGAVGVITRVDSGHLHHAIRVGVPTTTEPSLFAIETIGCARCSRQLHWLVGEFQS